MKRIFKVKEYGTTGKSLKRKKVCKYTKGEHEFELTLPKWYRKIGREDYSSPEEYWEAYEEEIKKAGGWRLKFGIGRLYACRHCGKNTIERKALETPTPTKKDPKSDNKIPPTETSN